MSEHDTCIADVSPDPTSTDVWEARCLCGWVGPQANEDAADTLARLHREVESLRAQLPKPEEMLIRRDDYARLIASQRRLP